MPHEELLTIAEVARRLGTRAPTVRRWVRRGLVPSVRVGQRWIRLPWVEILAAIRRHSEVQAARIEAPQ